jgi:hypothetical protein
MRCGSIQRHCIMKQPLKNDGTNLKGFLERMKVMQNYGPEAVHFRHFNIKEDTIGLLLLTYPSRI